MNHCPHPEHLTMVRTTRHATTKRLYPHRICVACGDTEPLPPRAALHLSITGPAHADNQPRGAV